MASRNQELQYIVIDDFSPGIWNNWEASSVSQNAPKGAATLSKTYGCCSGPNGALVPAPKIVQSMQQAPIDTAGGVNQYMTNDAQMHVMDFRVFSPIAPQATGGQALPQYPDQVWIDYSWFLITNSPTNTAMSEKARIRTYFTFLTDVNGNPTYPFTNASPAAPNIYDAMSRVLGLVVLAPTVAAFPHGAGTIDHTRANTTTPTLFGTPETVMAHSYGNAAGSSVLAYPKNSTPAANSTEAIPFSSNLIGLLMTHQDRTIGFRNGYSAAYGVNGIAPSSEIIEYTDVNNYLNATTAGLVFVAEHPTGYGSWISMNASTLMLVKQRGGGVLVSGALEQPNVSYMPGIPSTLGATNRGTITPNGGYIYGTSRGVYEWGGGDSAQLISPQFDGWFWRPTWSNVNGVSQTDKRLGLYGSFCYVTPYVFCPNNFLYDPRTGGWWILTQSNQQINPTPTYAFWDVSANGLAVGCSAAVDNTVNASVVDWFDTNQGQTSYSWQSHPLSESVNRELDFREISINVQCPTVAGSVIVTLSSPLQTSQVTFNIAITGANVSLSQPIDCRAYDVQVQVLSSANSGGAAAPIINRISVGYKEREIAR